MKWTTYRIEGTVTVDHPNGMRQGDLVQALGERYGEWFESDAGDGVIYVDDRRRARVVGAHHSVVKDKPPSKATRALAEEIAESLFVHGATRLVLEGEDGRDLGGWGRKPAVDRIAEALKGRLGK